MRLAKANVVQICFVVVVECGSTEFMQMAVLFLRFPANSQNSQGSLNEPHFFGREKSNFNTTTESHERTRKN